GERGRGGPPPGGHLDGLHRGVPASSARARRPAPMWGRARAGGPLETPPRRWPRRPSPRALEGRCAWRAPVSPDLERQPREDGGNGLADILSCPVSVAEPPGGLDEEGRRVEPPSLALEAVGQHGPQ